MRRRKTAPPVNGEPGTRRRAPRRFWSHAMLAAACILLVNGLVGERGLTETIRARRRFTAAAQNLARMRRDNEALRIAAQRLRSDPATIESVARGELGLVRRGEILVVIKDLRE